MYINFLYYTAATVSFKQSTYSIHENDDDLLKPVLVLSKVSSFDITVQVRDNSNTAVGECTTM